MIVNRHGAQKVLPRTISMTQVPLDIDVPTQPLHGRPGAVRTGKATLRPRQITIQGTIIHRDKETTRQELDALLPFLMGAPLEVYRHHDSDRHLRAYPVGAPQEWLTEDAELRLRLPMVAIDPYWYGPEATMQVTSQGTVEVDGSAPTAPFVRTLASAEGLTVTNAATGDQIAVTGAGVIEVDSADFACQIDGENSLHAINAEWLLTGFNLLPGANAITTSAPIELAYRPRWY